MLPTTTPVHFEPEVLHRDDRPIAVAIARERIVQTHFGPVTDLERLARRPPCRRCETLVRHRQASCG